MRKLAVYYPLGVLAILVLWLGIRYSATGRVIVTTKSSNSVITLAKLDSANGQKPAGTSTTQKLDIRLKAGSYVIKVNSKSFSSSKVITVKARTTSQYALNSIGLLALEPVSSFGAYSFAADGSSLLYVDSGSKILYRADAQNNLLALGSGQQFDSIKWADISYGVGRATDGKFYIINNGSVGPVIGLPFLPTDSKPVDYIVSSDKQIYIAHGTDVYSGTVAGGFKQIFKTRSSTPSLASWNNKLAILETPGDITNTSFAPSVTIIAGSGQVLSKRSFDADSAAWSQDGKYLALFSDNSKGEIVNSSLGLVADLPTTPVNSLSWAGDTLYYAINNQLWAYAVSTGTSQSVANASPGNTISDLALGADNAYLYMSVASNQGSSSQIYRFNLHGHKVPDYVYQLPIFLPDTSQPCSLSFINFTYPTIIGQSDHSPNQLCTAAVATVFAPYGIDTGLLHYHFSQAALGD